MVAQAAGKAIYVGEADNQMSKKIGKLAEHQNLTQYVINLLIQSHKFKAAATHSMKQHVEAAVHRKAKVRDHNIMREPGNDLNTPQAPLTGRSKNVC